MPAIVGICALEQLALERGGCVVGRAGLEPATRDYEKRRPSQSQRLCGLAGDEKLVCKKVCYEITLLLFL
jgi:hypothetical protein